MFCSVMQYYRCSSRLTRGKTIRFLCSHSDKLNLPPEPTNCCMSGCANCVWIAYALEMSKLLGDGGEAAKERILQTVKDPNLRAFLILELKSLPAKNPS